MEINIIHAATCAYPSCSLHSNCNLRAFTLSSALARRPDSTRLRAASIAGNPAALLFPTLALAPPVQNWTHASDHAHKRTGDMLALYQNKCSSPRICICECKELEFIIPVRMLLLPPDLLSSTVNLLL